MKSADITPGWYQYDSSPTGRYGRRARVYVFEQAPKYIKGSGYFSPFDPESGEEPITTVTDPTTGAALPVPARAKTRRYGRSDATQWIVGILRTGVKDDVYETDADGNYVENEDGEWVVKETRVLPDYWEFAIVRPATIIQTWAAKVEADARREAWQAEDAKRAEDARKARAAKHAEAAEVLAGYGLALTDVLSSRDAKSFLYGDGDTREVEKAIKIARQVTAYALSHATV
jgi:hypothetical protein